MIKLSNVRKSFGDNVVLDGIDLDISQGEICGLVGVSGAGKSTLLRCLNRLEEIDEGKIFVDGTDITTLDKNDLIDYRRQIGMVFQQFSLMERRTVYENVYLPLKCAHIRKSQVDGRIREILDLVGLSDKVDQLPRQLSGGQKQRVAIARALATQPKLLLSDEATSALDPNVTEDVLELLRSINRELGVTVVVVTHEISVMKLVCTKMALLHKGSLTAAGTTQEFFLRQPQLLEEFSHDVARVPRARPGKALIRVVHGQDERGDTLSRLAIDTGVAFEIKWGGFDRYADEILGSFILEADESETKPLGAALTARGIEWSVL
ncbi:MAG: methionine ABC transporter ATP-binding protein [Microbacterium sp.]